jgi:hypothetical protein
MKTNSNSEKRCDTPNLHSQTTMLRTELLRQIFVPGVIGQPLGARGNIERESVGENLSHFATASKKPTVSSGGCAE